MYILKEGFNSKYHTIRSVNMSPWVEKHSKTVSYHNRNCSHQYLLESYIYLSGKTYAVWQSLALATGNTGKSMLPNTSESINASIMFTTLIQQVTAPSQQVGPCF